MDKGLKASWEEILRRLMTRSEQIDRQLVAALEPHGLSPAELAKRIARLPPAQQAQLAEAGALLASTPVAAGATWEELIRPSLPAVSSRHVGRLVRA